MHSIPNQHVGESSSSPPPHLASANASTRHILRNAAMGYVASAVGMSLGFVVTPVLVRRLGSDLFGLWALMTAVIGYTGLIELGIGTAAAKRVAECRATGDTKRLESLLGTAFVMYAMMGLVVLLVTAGLYLVFPHIFSLPSGQVDVARKCLLILGVNQAAAFLFLIQTAVLFGSGRLDLASSLGIALNILSSLASILLVLVGMGIGGLAMCVLGTTVCNGLVTRWLIRRSGLGVSVRPRKASWPAARELLKFGSRNAFVAVCGTIAYGADSLVIGFMLPLSNVAHYAIAAKLVNLLRTLATKPIDVLMPAYAHSYSVGDNPRLFRLFAGSTAAALMIALPLVLCVLMFGDLLIRFWVGPGHEPSYGIVVCLALALLFQLPGHASFTIFTGTERNRFLIGICAVSAPLNLGLSVLLTWWLGPIGVALGSLGTVVLADMVLLPTAVCRQFQFDMREYLGTVLGPLLVPTAVTIVVGLALRNAPVILSDWVAVLMSAFVVLIFWCCRVVITPRDERGVHWGERIRRLAPWVA